MGLFSQATDLYAALRFLRLLTTRWEDTNAFKVGIIDADGKQLIKGRDVPSEHKKYYTLFHRLVFNIKRLLQKVPIVGKSILLNYASALLLLKEHLGIESDEEFKHILDEYIPNFINTTEELDEQVSISRRMILKEGIVVELNKDLLHPKTCEPIFLTGSKVRIIEQQTNQKSIFGIPIYEGIHEATGQKLFLSIGDCKNDMMINEQEGGTAATVSTGSVGNLDIAFKRPKKKKDRNISVFDVDDESFSKLMNPKIKHKRWKDYLNAESEQYNEIRKCVNRGDLVVLRDSKGASCTLRNYSEQTSRNKIS